MKKNIIYMTSAVLIGTGMLVSCSSDNENVIENGKDVVTAEAVVGDAATTRVSYTEQGNTGNSYKAGVTAAWESGDVLHAFETNSGTVTACTFSTTENTAQANFKSTNAATTSSSTVWKAFYGTGATISGTTITCGYDGQVGTLANLKKYDYMVATGSGTTPSFDFSAGTRLSYFIRLKLPASIKTIELNTSGTWTVTSTANTAPTPTTSTVTTVTLGSASSAGTIAYIAVPAIDYSAVGLIVTIFNSDGSQSQGKVLVKNLSSLGGNITTLDMSGLTLMSRPTSYVDLGTYGKWAPFNIGMVASPTTVEEAAGNFYAWGEIETVGTYSWDNYMVSKNDCGGTNDPISKLNFSKGYAVITGSRFDVARVKWGKGWKMPTYSNFNNLISLSHLFSTSYKTSPYDKVSGGVTGVTFTNNGLTLFFPSSGCKFDGTNNYDFNSMGYYWVGEQRNEYSSDHAPIFRTGDTVTSTYYENRYVGLTVRPIVAE